MATIFASFGSCIDRQGRNDDDGSDGNRCSSRGRRSKEKNNEGDVEEKEEGTQRPRVRDAAGLRRSQRQRMVEERFFLYAGALFFFNVRTDFLRKGNSNNNR